MALAILNLIPFGFNLSVILFLLGMRFSLFKLVAVFTMGVLSVGHSYADSVKYVVHGHDDSDSHPKISWKSLSNRGEYTSIGVLVELSGSALQIDSVRWVNCGKSEAPVQNFKLAPVLKTNGKKTEWDIVVNFPYTDVFSADCKIYLYTNRGVLSVYTSKDAEFVNTLSEIKESARSERMRVVYLALFVVLALLGVVALLYWRYRHRIHMQRDEISELSFMLEEGRRQNEDLRQKVDTLYGSRLATLNMLCNEYFEKNDSEKVRLTLYNEVERNILSLREDRNVKELEDIVNCYLDNILVRVREEIPDLNAKDIRLLTYLYAGFSPRAICIFCDIKIKNFYNRRARLKERILESTSPNRDYFVSKMQ